MSDYDFDAIRERLHARLIPRLDGHAEGGWCAPTGCSHEPYVVLEHLLGWCEQLREPGAPLYWPEMSLRIELEMALAMRVPTGSPTDERDGLRLEVHHLRRELETMDQLVDDMAEEPASAGLLAQQFVAGRAWARRLGEEHLKVCPDHSATRCVLFGSGPGVPGV